MEDKQHRDKDYDKNHKDPNQGNPQEDQKQQQQKGQEEKKDQEQNKNWDLAQRRQQASPRSYSENTDTENIQNQNTEADKEQINEGDNKESGFGGYGGDKVGDKASQRQQTIDGGDPQKDKQDRKENKK